MTTVPHQTSGLSKATWTDEDFADMGWHDCRVHAVSITDCMDDTLPPHRLLLDLDYIVRWVEPERRRGHFTFWVAPATLVFDGAWSIEGTLGPLDYGLEIAEVHRLDSPDDHADPLWRIEGHNFELRLRAAATPSTYGCRPSTFLGRSLASSSAMGSDSPRSRSPDLRIRRDQTGLSPHQGSVTTSRAAPSCTGHPPA